LFRLKRVKIFAKMPVLFKCKTGEAYQVKVLAELLMQNLKTGCFEINEEGINLRMFDQPRKTLVDLYLQAENFSLFKFEMDDKLSMGLGLGHFHKILKSIKKKDSLQLFIHSKDPTDLGIKTIPKENTRITTTYMKIQNIQNIETDVPIGYGKPINVPSSDFQKMCKELSSIGSANINIRSYKYHIDFAADADGILKREVQLGCSDESEDDEDDEVSVEPLYEATFSADEFSRIAKIAGLSNTLQIFPGNKNLPLMFRSSVGSLGKISLYIKSNELVERELDGSDSESEEEYESE